MSVRHRRLAAAGAVAASLALGGCAAVPTVLGGLASAITVTSWIERQAREARQAPEEGRGIDAEALYRQGIRDALAQVRRGGGFALASPAEPPRVTWVGPLMEEVWVPAQIVGGVMIPAHRQWVVVRPGYWQVGGQPLTTNAGAPARPPAFAPATWPR